MSTVSDPEGRPTVIDLIPPQFRKALVPVGRLDFQTEGLLLLTDDGEFAQRVSHPRYGCRKTYAVKVKGEPLEAELDKLRQGVVIDGVRTSPCRIKSRRGPAGGRETEGNTWWTVELFEGRTRQIREMFFRIEHPVQKLRRVAIGNLEDETLPLGACRELTPREVEMLRHSTTEPKPGKAHAPPPKRRARSLRPRPQAVRPAAGADEPAREAVAPDPGVRDPRPIRRRAHRDRRAAAEPRPVAVPPVRGRRPGRSVRPRPAPAAVPRAVAERVRRRPARRPRRRVGVHARGAGPP
jgi:pseudouridine synthase